MVNNNTQRGIKSYNNCELSLCARMVFFPTGLTVLTTIFQFWECLQSIWYLKNMIYNFVLGKNLYRQIRQDSLQCIAQPFFSKFGLEFKLSFIKMAMIIKPKSTVLEDGQALFSAFPPAVHSIKVMVNMYAPIGLRHCANKFSSQSQNRTNGTNIFLLWRFPR